MVLLVTRKESGNTMTRKKFTEEEILLLSENQYTMAVTKNTLSFTTEFKELFWRDYCNGMLPEQIVRRYRYDPEKLGKNHLEGLQYTIKKAKLEGNPFGNIMRPNLAREKGDNKIDTPHTDIKRLEQKVTYLEQEIEYLKKISSARTFKK